MYFSINLREIQCRGERVKVNKKILDRIFDFKSLRKSIHSVDNKYIYPVVWFEKGKKTEVIVMEEK